MSYLGNMVARGRQRGSSGDDRGRHASERLSSQEGRLVLAWREMQANMGAGKIALPAVCAGTGGVWPKKSEVCLQN